MNLDNILKYPHHKKRKKPSKIRNIIPFSGKNQSPINLHTDKKTSRNNEKIQYSPTILRKIILRSKPKEIQFPLLINIKKTNEQIIQT